MKINRENYESFFLDYIDGNLNPELYNQLIVFLENNPDLKEELNTYYNIKLSSVNYSGPKDILTRSNEHGISDIDFNLLRYIDGEMNGEELNNFIARLENDKYLKRELLYLENVKLEKEKIIYQEKKKLKKSLIISSRNFLYYAIGVAASVLIVILFFNQNTKEGYIIKKFANNTKKTNSINNNVDSSSINNAIIIQNLLIASKNNSYKKQHNDNKARKFKQSDIIEKKERIKSENNFYSLNNTADAKDSILLLANTKDSLTLLENNAIVNNISTESLLELSSLKEENKLQASDSLIAQNENTAKEYNLSKISFKSLLNIFRKNKNAKGKYYFNIQFNKEYEIALLEIKIGELHIIKK
ncbi:MAG: hypothetical protein A2X12_10295 [Bacteroidetes bacterium GWE2_29_8]|nr:MAG: hypothetical protein A2X12_10295 [Bacteroidetes bacterium GWE2_29_8]OFY17403.1 MAG: hypothetical protein A2X02_00715 [Bacteroidetes bacterium GWF2_29_10]